MVVASVVLAGALALPASAPEARLDRVQVQGEAAIAREKKTLAQLFKAQALFEQYHALAPAAALTFKVYPRTQAEQAQKLTLALVTPEARTAVELDAGDRFVIDPAWRQLDPSTELRSRLADGRVTWRPDIRTPGVPEGERRLGDLRLQCRVAFGSGVARGTTGFGRLLSLMFDDCWEKDWSPSNFADRPVFAVTLVHGERRLTISQLMLHGLRDDGGPDYDWGYSLRERMFRLPLGDESWPDDTRVVFETMEDPPAPPDAFVQALPDDWAQAALALSPSLSPANVVQRLGPPDDNTRFESGRRLQRRLHEIKLPAGPIRVEQVSLFDAEDRLLKTSLRRLAPARRD
ncbi:MAG: hypothetical protein EOP39_17240 [Rubrivivax sp.]|nr:MAG: hypothetical protein EOP39_17240 [Rubrivivax sp.]